MTDVLGIAGLGFIGIALVTLVYSLAKSPPTEQPATGARGLKRARALAAGGNFKTIEPLMRLVASWIAPLPLRETREKVDKQISLAGDWLGLTADEFLALSLISAVGFLMIGVVGGYLIDLDPLFSIFFFLMGTTLPYTRCTGERNDRFKAVNRGLPTAIDLAALCMGAGLDFPGALRQIVDKAADKDDPLTEVVQAILRELELGRTRRQALENFATRVPTEAVQDFVGAVIQAEEKGNPLAEVLQIQARMLRLRRSIRAEESAAKAGVMMMMPLMLIFCAIILILLGPFIIQGMNSGF
ncbi:MAG: type II secretion system F family protein [Myxococcota bacterium]